MPQLTDFESLVIVHWFNVCARAISKAAQADDLTDDQVQRLTECSDRLASTAANMADNIAQTNFQDADRAFGDISDGASQAAKVAQTMSADYKKANDELALGAQMITFGVAVLTGNYGSALGGLIKIVGAPKGGQGAKDPGSADS